MTSPTNENVASRVLAAVELQVEQLKCNNGGNFQDLFSFCSGVEFSFIDLDSLSSSRWKET